MHCEAFDDMLYVQIPPKNLGRFNNSGLYTAFFDTEDAAKECFYELLHCRRPDAVPSEETMVSEICFEILLIFWRERPFTLCKSLYYGKKRGFTLCR